MDKSEQFKSLDETTGMLTDIEEIQKAGVALAKMGKLILSYPLVNMFLPPSQKLDIYGLIVMYESMLRPMSQAEFTREMGKAAGLNPLHTEMKIRTGGLSETLPMTHPDAPTLPDVPDGPTPPMLRDSLLMREGEEAAKRMRQSTPPPAPRVALSDDIGAFLQAVEGLEDPHREE